MEELDRLEKRTSWRSFVPAALVLLGAFAMLGLRLQIGAAFVSDGALMMLALACYIFAALFQLTNLYAPSSMAEKIGFWTTALGVFFNLSSWLTRWVGAYDHEIAIMRASGNMANPWIFRYIPFANLYDLSLAFAFGAGFTTLLFAHRRSFRILSAFTLPVAALILTLARFIGDEFIDLPPVLDSYWRPIHVGDASLSYGVALVCFGVAVMYLLKDGIKVEAMAIWSSLFGIAVIGTVSKFSVFTEFVYRAGLFLPNEGDKHPFSTPFRLEIPYVGPAFVIAGVFLIGVVAPFSSICIKRTRGQRLSAIICLNLHSLPRSSLLPCLFRDQIQFGCAGTLEISACHNPTQYVIAGKAMAENQQLSVEELSAMTPQTIRPDGAVLYSVKRRPCVSELECKSC